MITETIKYTDYDGNPREDTFYFNLSQADLIRLEVKDSRGFKAMIDEVIAAKDTERIWEIFEQILAMAVGKKSADGRRFSKRYEDKADFLESEAYSEFVVKLIRDPKFAAEFINKLAEDANRREVTPVTAVDNGVSLVK